MTPLTPVTDQVKTTEVPLMTAEEIIVESDIYMVYSFSSWQNTYTYSMHMCTVEQENVLSPTTAVVKCV